MGSLQIKNLPPNLHEELHQLLPTREEWLAGVRRRDPVASRLSGAELLAPQLFDAEVVGALAGLERRGQVSSERTTEAAEDLGSSPVERFPHAPLLEEAWSLRRDVSTNDAFYVALARQLACPLLTTDGRLSRAPGLGITVTLVT